MQCLWRPIVPTWIGQCTARFCITHSALLEIGIDEGSIAEWLCLSRGQTLIPLPRGAPKDLQSARIPWVDPTLQGVASEFWSPLCSAETGR